MRDKSRPVLRYTNRIVAVLQRIARSDAPELTVSRLIGAMGVNAHRLLILMLTLLNMVPGPPGFGGMLAWTTFAVALFMVLGRPIRLPGIIGRRRLPLKLLLPASEQVVRVTRIITRFSRPRLRWLTSAAATVPFGLLTMFVSAFMTIPIPFINAVPNVGLCVIAFSMLNRDGAGVIAGVAITLVGLLIAGVLIFGVLQLGSAAIGSIF